MYKWTYASLYALSGTLTADEQKKTLRVHLNFSKKNQCDLTINDHVSKDLGYCPTCDKSK